MSRTVYEQHDAAFRSVSAFATLMDGKHVANVTVKHGTAVTAYVHRIGTEMQRGQAGGGGYDRTSAAISYAAAKIPFTMGRDEISDRLRSILMVDGCSTWARALEAEGFTVCNVIC